MGSIVGLHVQVHSKYQHTPALPMRKWTNPEPHAHASVDKGQQRQQHPNNISTTTNDPSHGHSHEYPHDHSHGHQHRHAHSYNHSQTVGEPLPTTAKPHSSSIKQLLSPLQNLPQFQEMLQDAQEQYIPVWVKSIAFSVFTELAKAKAATHGVTCGIHLIPLHQVSKRERKAAPSTINRANARFVRSNQETCAPNALTKTLLRKHPFATPKLEGPALPPT